VARSYGGDGTVVAKDNFYVLRQGSEVREPGTVRAYGPQGTGVNEPAMLKVALVKLSPCLVNMFDVFIQSGVSHKDLNGVVRVRVRAGIRVGSDNLGRISGPAGLWLRG